MHQSGKTRRSSRSFGAQSGAAAPRATTRGPVSDGAAPIGLPPGPREVAPAAEMRSPRAETTSGDWFFSDVELLGGPQF